MATTREILNEGAEFLNEEIRKAFQEQGHTLTGAWEKSLSTTSHSPDAVEGWAKSYGAIVDSGVTADRIPFGGSGDYAGSGVGIRGEGENETFHPTSKYIQGLFNFWKLRKPGISDKEALSLAFATAKVQKKEGISTWASRDYSATKERQRFIETAFHEADEQVADIICGGLAEYVNEEMLEEKQIVY